MTETETVEVHNAYAIHGLDEHGEEVDPAYLIYFRPQDWGDPQRWHYERFRLEWFSDKHYINNAHCWTDLKMPRHEYLHLFCEAIVQILMPGSKAELCGREYLAEDDFWDEEWGLMPPYYQDPDADYDEYE